MALPATDSFTVGADTALQTYSANWTINQGALTVRDATDDVSGNSGGNDSFANWNADTPSNDQYTKLTLHGGGGGQWVGPMVRVQAGAASGYVYETDGGNQEIGEFTAGSYSTLTSNGISIASGAVLSLEVVGTALTAKINGSTTNAPAATTDASFASGRGGIWAYNSGTSTRGDDFEVGNIGGGGGGGVPKHYMHYSKSRH